MNQSNQSQSQVQIKASDEKLKGEYSNVMQILHTKEEFVMDFLNVFPPTGTLNSRVIVSPGHFKRMVKAMQENLENMKTLSESSKRPKNQKRSDSNSPHPQPHPRPLSL